MKSNKAILVPGLLAIISFAQNLNRIVTAAAVPLLGCFLFTFARGKYSYRYGSQ